MGVSEMRGIYKRTVIEKRVYLVNADGEDDAWIAEVDDEGEHVEDIEMLGVEFVEYAINEPDPMDVSKANKEKLS
jgi:hypothetical protein